MRRLTCLLAAFVVALGVASPAEAVRDETILVSRAGGGPAGDGHSGMSLVSVSADGRYTAFTSEADNLDPESNDAFGDVFVYDRVADVTTLVSRATGADGAVGDGSSFAPSISADGRYVAFASNADNLDSDSNDSFADIFVRDLTTHTTALVSRASGATGVVSDNNSLAPSISGDGRHVAFHSGATGLDPDSNDGLVTDIFVRDLDAETTTLVSRATGPAGVVADDASLSPSISGDGRFVAFGSFADNLDPDSNDAVISNVFVRDLMSHTTTFVNRASGPDGAAADGSSGSASISADGRSVAFSSNADNLDNESTDGIDDVFVRDLVTEMTTLVSRATGARGAPGDSLSVSPRISADGNRIAFKSFADNLDDESSDSVMNDFVRDLRAGTTTFVNRASGANGAPADGSSSFSAISADGRVVVFSSDADNLDEHSNDSVTDVFLRDLLGPQLPPSLAISVAKRAEGKTGLRRFTFTVALSGIPGRTVTVEYETQDGSAVSASRDYNATSGVITFSPGDKTKQIVVFVKGDRKRERAESFTVELSNPFGAALRDSVGRGTIRNDD